MPDEPRDWRDPEERHETTDPHNPPNALLRPETRSRALMSYLAPVVVLFVVVGIALIYWANRGPVSVADEDREENAVGTVGRDAPGGTDPAPEFGGTRDEIRYRSGDNAAGDRPDAGGSEAVMDVAAVSSTAAGQRVRLQDIEVDAVDGSTLWIGGEKGRVAVVVPAGTSVSAGDRIDVIGTTEVSDQGTARIRASEVRQR